MATLLRGVRFASPPRTLAPLAILTVWIGLLMASPGFAQPVQPSFMLDDTPAAPLVGPPLLTGQGAENPYGLPVAPPVQSGPSPSLAFIPGVTVGDGDVFTNGFPTPLLLSVTPAGPYLSSLSLNTIDSLLPIYIGFSVDRRSVGTTMPSALAAEAALNQAPSDLFKSGGFFRSPSRYLGTLGPGPYAGPLNAYWRGRLTNTLIVDESVTNLQSGAGVAPLGFLAPPIGVGTHDNIDAYEITPTTTGVGPTAGWQRQGYFTAYPDVPLLFSLPVPNIYDVPAGGTTFCGLPAFATATTMGLGPGDVIDALIVFDNDVVGSVACGGPGAQPAIDVVLFSLAPGSPALTLYGLGAADIFLSDFTGAFALYARAAEFGVGGGGALPGTGDNIDAADVFCVGDLNNDGVVNAVDYLVLITGCPGLVCVDVNLDGVMDMNDINWLVRNLGCTS